MSDTEPSINPSPKARVPLKPRPIKPLPTDRVGFQRQMEILRAYAVNGESGRSVTNEQVAAAVNIAAQSVSLCNMFFADIGLLQRGDSGYIPSQEVLDFSRAYEWEPENAAKRLAPAIEKAWFATTLIPVLKFRALEDREAIMKLAEASSASTDYEPQLRMILDYLAVAGIIVRENGQNRLTVKNRSQIVEKSPDELSAQIKASQSAQALTRAPEAIGLSGDNVMPIPLGRGRLVKIELPSDWDSAKDLSRLLKILRLSLSDSDIEEDK